MSCARPGSTAHGMYSRASISASGTGTCTSWQPFTPPAWWRRYVTIDYGLDMLAAYLIVVDEHDMAYAVREVYQGRDLGEGAKGLIVSEAAQAVLDMVGEDKITAYLAPPDLWAARQETGRSVADIFAEHGIALTKTQQRQAGWLDGNARAASCVRG